jgi:hypothetical protein
VNPDGTSGMVDGVGVGVDVAVGTGAGLADGDRGQTGDRRAGLATGQDELAQQHG